MGIARDALAGDERDALRPLLGEAVTAVEADGDDAGHESSAG
jgi:hypothetical protein